MALAEAMAARACVLMALITSIDVAALIAVSALAAMAFTLSLSVSEIAALMAAIASLFKPVMTSFLFSAIFSWDFISA